MTPEQQIEFGKWLRQRRSEMSLDKVSRAFLVSKSAWQRYERGERHAPLDLILRLKAHYPDIPSYAVPDVFKGIEMAPQNLRVKESDQPQYARGQAASAFNAMSEFEQKLSAMQQAQSLVTKAFDSYQLQPAEHLTLHQTLVSLVIRNNITPSGLGELLQWYLFDQRSRRVGQVGGAPVPIGASRGRA